MEEDEYTLTEADVMDALQLMVTAEAQESSHHVEDAADADADDDDFDEDEVVDATSGQGKIQVRQPPIKPLANPYHNRQKQELQYLKRKVRELELELHEVEKVNDAKLAEGDSALWQRIAQQQNVEKQKALSENARLKEMLEEQIKFARSLERVIRKRPNLTAFGETSITPSRRKKRRSPVSLYDELSDSAKLEYKRTQEVLRLSGLGQMARDHRSIDVRVLDTVSTSSSSGDASADLRVDWTIVRRYPFPFQSVARELWKILSYANVGAHITDMDRNVDRTEDTLYATTTLKVPVASTHYSLSATALIRQYVDEDSVTVVWISDGECIPTKGAVKDTFKLYETGWINVQPAPGDPSSCVCRTLGYYFPSFSARTRGDSPTPSSGSENEAIASPADATTSQDSEGIGVLTELLSTVYGRSASQVHTAIENALMVEAVAQTRVDTMAQA